MSRQIAELLADQYPPLKRYWPNLWSVSAPQAAFLVLDDFEAFYGGAAGGGKSDALLAAALQYVDAPNYAALILRKTFRQLDLPDSIMSRSKEWLMPHRVNGVQWNDDAKRWTFPSGATLTFGYLDHDNDVYNYQGPAFQFVGWDELTQFEEKPYKYLFSRTRRRKDSDIPIRHRSASNPGGIGHKWVFDRFVSKETREKESVFIPAKVDDNPGLDVAEYKQSLSYLPETLQQQLLDGDWGVFEGAAFTVTPVHEIPSFELEDSHHRFEALDYGLNGAPWCLWATDYEGNLIAVDMGYWRDELPSDICPEVIEFRKRNWGLDNTCYADPSLWKRTYGKNKWGKPAMLTDEFSDNGIILTAANNDPRAGLARIRELLKLDPTHSFPDWHPHAGEKGSPRIFFTRACADLVDELRAAPLQPLDQRDGGEIVDPKWEGKHGHAVAMARYATMSKPDASEEPTPFIEDTRESWIANIHAKRDKDIERMKRRPALLSYFTG